MGKTILNNYSSKQTNLNSKLFISQIIRYYIKMIFASEDETATTTTYAKVGPKLFINSTF